MNTYKLTQTGPETQDILDEVNVLREDVDTNTEDIEQLQELYEAFINGGVVIIQPTDTWPVANPTQTAIYRVIDRENTPPEYYADYMWNGTSFVKMAQYDNNIDDEPTADSDNLVRSGGVFNYVATNGSAFDISVANASGGVPAGYADLADALGTNGANVPSAVRKGGMSVKFIQQTPASYSVVVTPGAAEAPTGGVLLDAAPEITSGSHTASDLTELSTKSALPTSVGGTKTYYFAVTGDTTTYTTLVVTLVQNFDHKYVQYRYMLSDVSTAATFTNVANWQSMNVDDEPTAGSDNLVKSGGVYSKINQEKQRAEASEQHLQENIDSVKEETLEENREMVNSILENYAPIEIIGNVTNAPDEEDLTSVNVGGTDVLKFKDKVYNPLTYNGMGRVYLRKNLVNGVNILTQDMFYKGEVGSRVPNTNTIFVIQYDFELAENIIVPAGCVLKFDGGSLSNGTLTGNSTCIDAGLVKIFGVDIDFDGDWKVAQIYLEWFGAVADYERTGSAGSYVETGTDNTDAFQKACELCNLTHSKVFITANKKPFGISKTKRINLTSYEYVNIEGFGMGYSVIKMMADGIRGFHGTNNNAELRLANFTIIGRHEENTTLGEDNDRPISVSAKRGLAENVEVLHSRQMSLCVGGWLDCRVDGCHVEYSARDGISVVGHVNIQVTNCKVRHCHDDAVAFHRDIYSGTTTDANGNIVLTTGGTILDSAVIISNNIFEDSNGVVGLGAVNTIISNNVFKLMKSYAMHIGGWSSSYLTQGNNPSSSIDIHDNIIVGVISPNYEGFTSQTGHAIWISAKSGTAGKFNTTEQAFNPLYSVLYKNQNSSSAGESTDSGTLNLSVHNNLIIGKAGSYSNYSELGVGYRFRQNGGMVDPTISNNGETRSGIFVEQLSLSKLLCYDNTICGCTSAMSVRTEIDHVRIMRNLFYDCKIGINTFETGTIYKIGELILENNDFNLDPFLTRGSYKTSPANEWNDSSKYLVYAISVNTVTWTLILGGNWFQNLFRSVHGTTSGRIIDNGNTYVLDLTRNNNNGIPLSRGIGIIRSNENNTYILKDLDPSSTNYGKITSILRGKYYASSMPTAPIIYGMRVINSDPSTGIAYWIAKGCCYSTTDPSSYFTIVRSQNVGASNNRPLTVFRGSSYFDTSMGKPIYWNSDHWVDATGTSVTYKLIYNLTNITASNQQTPDAGQSYSTTLTAASGYTLPSTITVKIGSSTLTATTDYTYNYTTGAITVVGIGGTGGVTGNLTITASGVANS